MRLSVFSPEASTQLFIDLKKLYQNYLTEQQLSNASLEQLINAPDKQFFVTLFNARHLGAVEVELHGSTAQLNLLCVRDITRRRGVAKNLLREVEKRLESVDSIELSLEKIKASERQGMKLFMQACGYQLTDNKLVKSLI